MCLAIKQYSGGEFVDSKLHEARKAALTVSRPLSLLVIWMLKSPNGEYMLADIESALWLY